MKNIVEDFGLLHVLSDQVFFFLQMGALQEGTSLTAIHLHLVGRVNVYSHEFVTFDITFLCHDYFADFLYASIHFHPLCKIY